MEQVNGDGPFVSVPMFIFSKQKDRPNVYFETKGPSPCLPPCLPVLIFANNFNYDYSIHKHIPN